MSARGRMAKARGCWHTVLFGLVLAAGLGLGFSAGSAEARTQQAPGSRVTIDLPEGYQPATQFSGFINEVFGVSIVIAEMPAEAYDQIATGMTAEALATRGIRDAKVTKLERPGAHVFMRGEQASPQGDVAKFLLVFRDKSVTTVVTANVPKSALVEGRLKPADIETALATAAIADTAAPQRELFRLGYLGALKPAGAFMGTARLYTQDGKAGQPGTMNKGPVLIVAPSVDKRSIADLDAHAERVLGTLPGLEGLAIAARSKLQIAGQSASEIIANAKDRDSKGDVVVYQAVVSGKDGGYVRIVGQAPANDRDTLIAEFRRMAQSLELLP